MVADSSEVLKTLAIKLHEIDAIKFGNFQTKSGLQTPIYFDLRVIIAHPDVMDLLANLLLNFVEEQQVEYEHICGVPYTALPIATLLSSKQQKPMLIRRKEAKSYGTKKLIEGKFGAGDSCLIIEDIITSGSSILETVSDLRAEGIVVNDAIVVIDREQGGAANITRNGVRVHSLFKISEFLGILRSANRIDDVCVREISEYIANNQASVKQKEEPTIDRTKLSYEARLKLSKSPIAKDLLQIIISKKTNLCLAADSNKTVDILNAADAAGPYICVLKTHIDIIDDFNDEFVRSLTALAAKHNFLIMEDRKFADIGNTVSLQYGSGIFHIADWAHLVTVHSLTGPSILQGLKNALNGSSEKRGVFLLAELSSAGSLITPSYTESTMKLVSSSPDADFVAGIVCQTKGVVQDPGLLQLTPGCKIDTTTDGLGQQYNTPAYVVKEKGADIAVVGRGILNAKDIRATAELYRDQLWTAYCERIN
ncbi:uridine 5'-monophosphate synthase [Contarinia nasturtii]|uniref:uridine 5'-monophosphate synthase n=1 Tax=Contarinia nasturtii TaxID=265458 RepID=UPI0012D3FFC9|nr:uridine 5'-monophosphate synthase [Contarinia nasturtii]